MSWSLHNVVKYLGQLECLLCSL